jgi:serine/threonine protein kinase
MTDLMPFVVANFRQLLKSGEIVIIKDYSNTRSNVDEYGRYYPEYDRFQVLLCRYRTVKFVIKALLYQETSTHTNYLDTLDAKYRQFNELDQRFMKYYGRFVCSHQKIVPNANLGLFNIISTAAYCSEYKTMYHNTIMFFEYKEHDTTLLEFCRYNVFNIRRITDVFARIVDAMVAMFKIHGFVHGDLNLRNILISGDEVSFIDFDDSSLNQPLDDLFRELSI